MLRVIGATSGAHDVGGLAEQVTLGKTQSAGPVTGLSTASCSRVARYFSIGPVGAEARTKDGVKKLDISAHCDIERSLLVRSTMKQMSAIGPGSPHTPLS